MTEYKASLKDLLEEKGVKQSTIAALCDVTQQTVSRWILRQREPSLTAVVQIAFFLGKRLDEVVACFI